MRLIFFVIICFAVIYLSADEYTRENYMDTLWTQYGEIFEGEDHSGYGIRMTTIDFNGDNIDDLIVEAGDHVNAYKKYYFYLGGDDFDNIADYTIFYVPDDTTTYRPYSIMNIGDFNGDEYDDFLILWQYYDQSEIYYTIKIFFCGPNFDLSPDVSYSISGEGIYAAGVWSIGDVNGDGYCDLGYIIYWDPIPGGNYEGDEIRMFIIWGNNEGYQVEYYATTGTFHDASGWYSSGIYAIGNINGDTYDDFMVKYYDPEIGHTRNYLYYGGNPPDTLADFSLEVTGGSAFGCGDYNNDDFNDFIGTNHNDRKFWYGTDQPLNDEPDLLLSDSGSNGYGFGDLNNDGYSDIVMANSVYSLWDGKVYIYIGGNTNSTSYDYTLYTHNQELDWAYGQLGYSIAVGDFNNDGFDDIAAGAPDENGRRNFVNPSYTGYGRVFVFAGNGDLTETDPVDSEDNEIPSLEDIELNVYPNPFNPVFKFQINTEFNDNKNRALNIKIYNIKGQGIETLPLLNSNENSVTWQAEDYSSGIYFAELIDSKTDQVLSRKKVTLLK